MIVEDCNQECELLDGEDKYYYNEEKKWKE